MATRKISKGSVASAVDDEQRKKQRKQIRVDKSAARVRRYDAKTEARRKAGGAGFSIMFYRKGGSRTGRRRWSGPTESGTRPSACPPA